MIRWIFGGSECKFEWVFVGRCRMILVFILLVEFIIQEIRFRLFIIGLIVLRLIRRCL